MEGHIAQIIVFLIGAAVVALVGGFFKLRSELHEHKLHVAENYVKTPQLTKIETAMTAIQHQLEEILKTVYELKGASGPR